MSIALQICDQKKLYRLPRGPGISQILTQYETTAEKSYNGVMRAPDRQRFSVSLREYFEAYCRSHLLYDDRERRQYDRLIKDDRYDSCTNFFGGEHLLRLMAKLPELIAGLPGNRLSHLLNMDPHENCWVVRISCVHHFDQC